MANHEVTPVYSDEMRMLETTDPNHASVFNKPFGQLLNNTAYLKNEVDKAGGIVHYNAFSEVDETFDAMTPIVTLFQAMQPNSILNCVVNQANSVYPSAQGSLNLTKVTETEGNVQFLSSDGKLSTGAFTKTNESSGGGVLADTEISFTGWTFWASESEHRVKSYTTLEQIGLSDADMAEDDFVENLAKINIALGAGYVHLFIMLSDSQPNLRESLLARMENDGIECRSAGAIGEFTLFLDRPVDIHRAIKIEVMMDIWSLKNKVRNKTIIAYANLDNQNMIIYPFREVATTDYGVITPMNGWESPGSTPAAVRSGRYVDVNFGFENGIVTNGTVIGKVPEGFRPCETRTIPVIADAHAEYARLVVYTNGDIKLFGANEATKKIVGTGGFMI